MAITVSGLTTHTQNGSGTWQDWGTGGGSTSTTATFLSGTTARGRKFTAAKGFGFEVNASGTDLSSSIVLVRWLVNGGLDNTLAGGGVSIRMEDTSGNISDWYVAGSDTYNGGWEESVIDTANAESANNGTAATLTAIQYVGIYLDPTASSGGDPNVYIDEVLSMPNTGLTLQGNTTNVFAELADWDDTSLYGIISRRSGVIFSKCPLILSPDASDHASTDETIVFEEPVYEDGTNVDSALTLQGLSSADADTITLTRLIAVCADNSLIGGTNADKELDFGSATDIVADTCTFRGFNGTTMALGGSGNSYDDCTFQACSEITDTGAVVRRGFVRDTAAAATEAALLWTTSSDWEDTTFVMGSSNSHAIENETVGINDIWTGFTFTGYSTSAGPTSVGDEVLIDNAASGTSTFTVTVTGTVSYRENGSATVDIITSPVTTTVTVLDARDNSVLENARVLVKAGSTGNEPYQDSVTITRVSTTATVAHTAHGLSNSEKVLIEGVDNGDDYNGVKTISNVSTNAYDYTVDSGVPSTATGTITSTGVIIEGLTNASGVISDTRPYAADQSIEGVVRRATGPFADSPPLSGTIDTADGLALTVQLAFDG